MDGSSEALTSPSKVIRAATVLISTEPLTLIDRLNVVVEFDERVNAQSTVALLKKLQSKHRKAKNIYVICDNARYYRSRLVKEFLKESKEALHSLLTENFQIIGV